MKNGTMQNEKAAIVLGSIARGEACANLLFAEVKSQAGALKRFLSDIHGMTYEGRRAFRSRVGQILKDARKACKDAEGSPDEAAVKSTARSAGVRLSEAVTFSKACDAGFNPDMSYSYHILIGYSREYLRTSGATGPTQKRGRKKQSFLDALKAFVQRQGAAEDDLEQGAELLATLAKLKPATM